MHLSLKRFKMKSIWLFIFLFIYLGSLSAQVHDHDHDHDHDHNHDPHHEHVQEEKSYLHKYHIGMANAPAYFLDGEEHSFGMHLHLIRMLRDAKFGIGLAYERIFNERQLNNFGIVGTYRITNEWLINASPGISVKEIEADSDFTFQLETIYEFMIHGFHLGPVFQFAYDPDDTRVSLGLHLGYSWN